MDVRKQILSQMKTKGLKQKELAKLLGMSESQMSMSLKILSEGFIDRLEKQGITIESSLNRGDNSGGDNINIPDAITQEYKGSNSSQQESDMHGNFVGSTKEVNHNYNSPITVELIKELTEPYKITINVLQKTIEEKDKRILELEEKFLSKKC